MVYVTVDGQRVASAVAYDLARMAAAFKRDTGCDLYVTSGTRTRQEQIDIFLSRYVTSGNVNGRRVYDTRWWNGTLYYRVSSAGTVAVPGTSNHEEDGPIGPRALDLRDSGADSGVTTRGTARDKWMEAHAGEYNFKNAGYNFSEPWHKEWTGADPHAAVGSGAGSATGDPITRARQNWLNTSRNAGLVEDGVAGPATIAAYKAYQEFLRAYGYTGDIDGDWGPGTDEAHAKFVAAWTAEQATKPPAFPLPAGKYFGPEAGGDNSVSGWYGNGADLAKWQQRMIDRGWNLGPAGADGKYGPKGQTDPATSVTGQVALAFQKEKGYMVDGEIGPQTWNGAWTEPVVPITPPPVVVTPPPVVVTPPPIGVPSGLITPVPSDFPSWIQYEVKLDPEAQVAGYAAKWQAYYQDRPYAPVESHTHWWGDPTAGYTHDGTVSHTNSTEYLGVNYITSAGRITLSIPLDTIALTTGQRNPEAWKSENDPKLTELGYKTLGYLHYIVELRNPHLKNEPIRLHKEFMQTSCSGIDVAKVRDYANKFASGALDPKTGLPPVVVVPPVVVPPVVVPPVVVDKKKAILDLLAQLKTLIEAL